MTMGVNVGPMLLAIEKLSEWHDLESHRQKSRNRAGLDRIFGPVPVVKAAA